MIGEVEFIADMEESGCKYKRTSFRRFMNWLSVQVSFQFDIETDVTKWWHDKQLISMQFGSTYNTRRSQWFLQWSALTPEEQEELTRYLNESKQEKIIHNVRFEYIVLRNYGIRLSHVYDTMVAEKILTGGIDGGDYALDAISWKYLRIIMNKALQTSFGDNIITPEKIAYGITDVAYLDIIRGQQMRQAGLPDRHGYDLLNVFGLEMEAILAFSDITYNGIALDKEKWRENVRLAEPIVQAAYDKLNAWVFKEPFHSYCVENNIVSVEDRVTMNWRAPAQRTELLKLVYPDLTGAGKPILKKYLKDNAGKLDTEDVLLLTEFMEQDYDRLQRLLLCNHREYLLHHDYLVPAGQTTINWNSDKQTLPFFRTALPKLQSVAEEERKKFNHPALKDLEEYLSAVKLTTTYGEAWIQKYVSDDGKARTNFDLIKTTGRVSSANPNMQNIIVTELVGTRYRNAFVCEEGFEFVDSDYASQELCIIADMSQDPVWLDALAKGQDLHSICSELLYGKRWKEAAESDCLYYKMETNSSGQLGAAKRKCSCKKHKVLRTGVKSINFG